MVCPKSMRLRIQTKAPLLELKAWYSPHPQNVLTTVSELKQALCRQIPLLKTQHVTGKDIILLLDDFELLDDNPLDVVRDGDLILIAASMTVPVKTEEQMDGEYTLSVRIDLG